MYKLVWCTLIMAILLIVIRIIYMIYVKIASAYKMYKQNMKRKKKEQEKKNFATPKKRKRLERKKRENKKKKHILKTYIIKGIKSYFNSYKMLGITVLVILIVLGLMIIRDKSMITFKSHEVEKNIKVGISFIVLVIINSGFIVAIKKYDDIPIKILTIWFIITEIAAVSLVLIGITVTSKKEEEYGIISFVCILMTLIYIMYMIAEKWINPWIGTILVMLLYVFILAIAGGAFGLYYLKTFPQHYENEIQIFNSHINSENLRSIVIVIKVGVKIFYQFPTEEIYCKVSLFQFLIGKVTEMLFLGSLISKFGNLNRTA